MSEAENSGQKPPAFVELDEGELDRVRGGAQSAAAGQGMPIPKWDAPEVKIDLTDRRF